MIGNDLTDYLSTQGIGTIGTDLFRGPMLPVPDAAVFLVPTGGVFSIHAMSSSAGQGIERSRVQVIVRATTFDAAATKSNDVFKLLDGLKPITINSTRYLWAFAIAPPAFIERDDDDREIFSTNYEFVKDLTA